MFRFKVKLLLLILLGLGVLGSNLGTSVSMAISCGKCDYIANEHGQVVGFACIQKGTHGCTATTSGCEFTATCGGDELD
jgi:hypothetical protein